MKSSRPKSRVKIRSLTSGQRQLKVSLLDRLCVSIKNPLEDITKEKITEDQARDLAQKYADKNLAGFKVTVGYGGGYTTECYKIDSPTTGRYQSFYSVEYSIDAGGSLYINAQSCL